jgi:hypothetical protein
VASIVHFHDLRHTGNTLAGGLIWPSAPGGLEPATRCLEGAARVPEALAWLDGLLDQIL